MKGSRIEQVEGGRGGRTIRFGRVAFVTGALVVGPLAGGMALVGLAPASATSHTIQSVQYWGLHGAPTSTEGGRTIAGGEADLSGKLLVNPAGGKAVGSYIMRCTAAQTGPAAEDECVGTAWIGSGFNQIQFGGYESAASTTSVLAVTGGTGTFLGARGQVKISYASAVFDAWNIQLG